MNKQFIFQRTKNIVYYKLHVYILLAESAVYILLAKSAAMIHSPHNTMPVAIFASWYQSILILIHFSDMK